MRRALAVALLAVLLASSPAAQAAPVGEDHHWPRRTIYVVDHTGTPWPVTRSAVEWNETGAVAMRVRAACRTGYPCVHVYSTRTYWLNCSMVGMVAMSWAGDVMRYARVTMNRRCNFLPFWQRKSATVHELGHVLGLSHDTSRGSIMYSIICCRSTPSAYDARRLRTEYAGLPW